LRPGTRVVSHDYDMGGWKPQQEFTLDAPGKPVGRDPVSKVYFWVVPANVTGDWALATRGVPKPREYVLKFAQKFQFAEGTVESGAARAAMEQVQLDGARLAFKARLADASGRAVLHEFSGRVFGDSIEGTLKLEGAERALQWRARRTGGKTVI